MSLCNQVLDVADDLNKSILSEIVKEFNPPARIKTAQVATRESQEKMGRENFALVALTKEGKELRKFPINDEANTWLSCHYFEKTSHKLPSHAKEIAGGMLKKACAVFGLDETPALKKVAKAHNSNVYREINDLKKTAQVVQVEVIEPDSSKHFYALGSRYAMPTPDFVKKAEAYFKEYERNFGDAKDRHEFAANVIERSKELNVPLEHLETLSKYAGAEYGDVIDTQIRLRLDLLQSRPEMSAALEKVATFKNELSAEDFSKLLYAFDKKASLERYYDNYLADAFKATFDQRFTKRASGYSWESLDGDLDCNEAELVSAFEKKAEKIKGYFGVTIADQLKKHGCSLFESLPTDAKETIAKIAKGKL